MLLNVALVARVLVHRMRPSVSQHPNYGTINALDGRIYSERVARFGSLPPADSDVLFVGDSIAGLVETDLRERLLEGDAPAAWRGVSIGERAIPSVTTLGILSAIPKFQSIKAKTIFLWCGTNDLAGTRSIDDIFSTYRQVVASLQQTHPGTRIVLVSVLPIRWQDTANARGKELNSKIAQFARSHQMQFVDLTGDVSDATGRFDESLTWDGVHPLSGACLKLEIHLAAAI